VRRYAERIDIALLAELLELKRVMALMAIKDKQVTRSYCTRLCMSVKVLKLLNSKLVGCLSIVADCDRLVARDCCVLVLGREVVLAG
jgi:hypothetical protein